MPTFARGRPRKYGMRSILALLLSLLLAGCAKRYGWQEDVLLPSGEMVTAVRQVAVDHKDPIGGPSLTYFLPESSFDLKGPAGMKLPGTWSFPELEPLLVGQDGGEWYVVATFHNCDVWDRIGRPTLPYAEFRFNGLAWKQAALSPSHIGLPANLAAPAERDMHGLYIWERKKRLLADSAVPERFRKIVDKWENRCADYLRPGEWRQGAAGTGNAVADATPTS